MTKVMNGYRKFPLVTATFLHIRALRKLMLIPDVKPEPEKVPKVKDSYYTDLKLGNAFMIMKGDGGELYGYGDNRFGQCGYNSEGKGIFAEPALVQPSTGIDDFMVDKYTVGMQYTLAVDCSKFD
jgi:alpha-tubulin suppressor-like RCC1 family protein